MLTSNGLTCLSGVTMCRMCLSAMASPARCRSPGWIGSHPSDDLRAAIEPRADPDVQTLAGGIAPRRGREAVSLLGRGREGEAGRAPGALPDAVRSGTVEKLQARSDRRTGEAAAALHGREVTA